MEDEEKILDYAHFYAYIYIFILDIYISNKSLLKTYRQLLLIENSYKYDNYLYNYY